MELYDEKYKNGTKKFMEAAKDAAEAYKNYQKVLLEKSPFDKKTTELLLLSASCAIQCSYCIDTHSKRARLSGANDTEIAYAIQLAASVKHGATVSYGVNALGE
ncbi:MAG: carboxymuconolactone decarboxylase family protein [archaeon]